MNQQDLADLCNFDKADMSKIESGKANPTIKTLLRISQALDVKFSDLFQIYKCSGYPDIVTSSTEKRETFNKDMGRQ